MIQKYFAGDLRPDQKESWKAEDGIFVLYTDHLAALAEKDKQQRWVYSHMQILRNECLKIIDALHIGDSLSVDCGDKDLEETSTRVIAKIAALTAENKRLRECLFPEQLKIIAALKQTEGGGE